MAELLKKGVAFMATEKESVVIKDGPTKHFLMDALEYAYDRLNPFVTEFTIEDRGKIWIKIISLAHEDGSGKSFLFEGYIHSAMFRLEGYENAYSHRDENRRIHGCYNTAIKKGWLKLGFPPLRKLDTAAIYNS